MQQTIEDDTFGTPENISNCRVADIGMEGYAECLRQGPNFCTHALPFGYCHLCHHPQVGEIIRHMYELEQSDKN